MVNVDKLRGKMVEKRLNVSMLADKIGIDRTTLYRKLNGNGSMFTIKEADAIVRELNIPPEEAMSIFFNQFVAEMRITN